MPVPGDWQSGGSTTEDAHSIAYPFAMDFSGVLLASSPFYHFRTAAGLVTQESWDIWPDSKVSGGAVSWSGTYGSNSYRYLRSVRNRDLSIATMDDLQNFRKVRTSAPHPGATLPPGAVGIEYAGGSATPVATSVTVTPSVAAEVLNSGTPVTPTVPWTFAVKAEAGLHATAYPASPYYQYGGRDDITITPSSWSTLLTGTASTTGTVTLSDTSFTLALDATEAFSLHIVTTSTSGDSAQDAWRWQPRVMSLTMQATFSWPDYRYLYDGGGMWSTRQRQTLAGNVGGFPLRQRGNGNATGAWSLRQRQTGN